MARLRTRSSRAIKTQLKIDTLVQTWQSQILHFFAPPFVRAYPQSALYSVSQPDPAGRLFFVFNPLALRAAFAFTIAVRSRPNDSSSPSFPLSQAGIFSLFASQLPAVVAVSVASRIVIITYPF